MRRTVAICLTLSALTAASAGHAATTVGDWTVRAGRTMQASTTDAAGDRFGQWCNAADGNCDYELHLPQPCEVDERYVVLANSDASVNAAELVCAGALRGDAAKGRRLYRYQFAHFGAIDHQVRQSRRIGFAFPVEGDSFRVARFSLQGALGAIARMRDDVLKRSGPTGRASKP